MDRETGMPAFGKPVYLFGRVLGWAWWHITMPIENVLDRVPGFNREIERQYSKWAETDDS